MRTQYLNDYAGLGTGCDLANERIFLMNYLYGAIYVKTIAFQYRHQNLGNTNSLKEFPLFCFLEKDHKVNFFLKSKQH